MNIPVYNLQKEKISDMNVPDVLFGATWKPLLVEQAIITQQANSRQKTALVKGRGDVRGGGKKPWKQKGTGRARHGSIRSPLWIGGGVTHGPTAERTFEKKINRKMRWGALCSLISKKYKEGTLILVDGISPDTHGKTGVLSKDTQILRKELGSIALITSSRDKKLFLASRNIPKFFCIAARSLNVVDVARPKGVIVTTQAIQELMAHYIKKNQA